MWKCQWPEMPTKLLKNGKQQKKAPLPSFFSLVFFLFSPEIRNLSGLLLASWQPSVFSWGASQDVWLKQGQRCARHFWWLCGYLWPVQPWRSIWVLSQIAPFTISSLLEFSVSRGLWRTVISLGNVKEFQLCSVTSESRFLSFLNL